MKLIKLVLKAVFIAVASVVVMVFLALLSVGGDSKVSVSENTVKGRDCFFESSFGVLDKKMLGKLLVKEVAVSKNIVSRNSSIEFTEETINDLGHFLVKATVKSNHIVGSKKPFKSETKIQVIVTCDEYNIEYIK